MKKTELFFVFALVSNNCFSYDNSIENCDYLKIDDKEYVFSKNVEDESYLHGWANSPSNSSDSIINSKDYGGKKLKILNSEPFIDYLTNPPFSKFKKAITEDCRLIYARFTEEAEIGYADVISIEEIQKIKKYIGKTLWINLLNYQNGLIYFKNENNDEHLKNIQKINIKDVYIGNIENSSAGYGIYLKAVTENKKIGFIPFDESYFYEKNPINNKSTPRVKSLIFNMKIGLGMKKDDVLLSWGKPEKINRNVGKYGVHEQWIYDDTYLYFDNGILTSFQD